MLIEAIALLAPPLLALGWYDRLRQGHLRPRQLMFAYAVFVCGINGLLYIVILHLLGHESVVFTDKFFIKYLIAGGLLAFAFALMLNLLRNSISVRITRNE